VFLFDLFIWWIKQNLTDGSPICRGGVSALCRARGYAGGHEGWICVDFKSTKERKKKKRKKSWVVWAVIMGEKAGDWPAGRVRWLNLRSMHSIGLMEGSGPSGKPSHPGPSGATPAMCTLNYLVVSITHHGPAEAPPPFWMSCNSVTLHSGHMTSIVLSILERDPPLLLSWRVLRFFFNL